MSHNTQATHRSLSTLHKNNTPSLFMPSIQPICITTLIIITLVLGVSENVTAASEQVVALSDTQSVTITFPDTDYYYPTPEGCEGSHCPCNYGQWTLLKPLTVYESRGDTSHSLGQLSAGDTVVSQQGWLHVDRPGVVAVRDTALYWPTGPTSKTVLPGDTLFVMQPTCETHFIVWYKNELIDMEAFWDLDPFWKRENGLRVRKKQAELLLKPKLSWWIQITSPKITEGWLRVREDHVFDGVGRCCPKFKIR